MFFFGTFSISILYSFCLKMFNRKFFMCCFPVSNLVKIYWIVFSWSSLYSIKSYTKYIQSKTQKKAERNQRKEIEKKQCCCYIHTILFICRLLQWEILLNNRTILCSLNWNGWLAGWLTGGLCHTAKVNDWMNYNVNECDHYESRCHVSIVDMNVRTKAQMKTREKPPTSIVHVWKTHKP